MTWTAAADAMLKRLWDRGGSLTSVARAMTARGFPVTRGAVSGRRMRLGLTLPRNFSQPRPPREPRMKKAKPMVEKRNGVVTHWDGVDYLANTEAGCKAILETRDHLGLRKCCGRLRGLSEKGSLSPYCDHHTEAYSQPATKKAMAHGEGSEVRKY
jgi:hypothetical protein